MRLALSEGQPAGSALEGCVGFDCVQRYIDAADGSYAWRELPEQRLTGTSGGIGWTGHVLTMTSQKWLSEKDTDHQTWTHPIVVVVPDNLLQSSAKAKEWVTLVAGGAGSTTGMFAHGVDPSLRDVKTVVGLATRTGAISALLLQVPNQAFAFGDDSEHKQRTEDEVKAYTWRHVLDHPSEAEWAIEMPNAKATVRAMDAVTEFLAGQGPAIGRFALSGCSKRANAAMMACAHEARCELLLPCAMTTDIAAHTKMAYRSYGQIPFAAHDYVDNGVFDRLDTPEFDRLGSLVNAQTYLSKLTVPKLWLSSNADDFFLADHTRLFWQDLPSPKYLFVRENGRHAAFLAEFDADTADFLGPASAFISAALLDEALPEIDWRFDEDSEELVVSHVSGPAPTKVTVWSGRTCAASGRRDFRRMTLDTGFVCLACGAPSGIFCDTRRTATWTSRPLSTAASTWRVSEPTPEKGWAGFYVAFEFAPPAPRRDPVEMTTEVFVVPRGRYPFGECSGADCGAGGRLVLAQTHDPVGDGR